MKKYFLFFIACALFFSFGKPAQAASCPVEVKKMYKTAQSPSLYYISEDCKKRPVKNKDIFSSYEDSWTKVKVISSAKLSSIPNHELGFLPWGPRKEMLQGSLVKSTSNPYVYYVSTFPYTQYNTYRRGVILRPFKDEKTFLSFGFQWNQVEDVSDEWMNVYLKEPLQVLDRMTETIDGDNPYTWDGMMVQYKGSSDIFGLRRYSYEAPLRKYKIKNEDEFKSKIRARFDRIAEISDIAKFNIDNYPPDEDESKWKSSVMSDVPFDIPIGFVDDGLYALTKGSRFDFNDRGYATKQLMIEVGDITSNQVTFTPVFTKVADKTQQERQTPVVLTLGQTKVIEDSENAATYSFMYKEYFDKKVPYVALKITLVRGEHSDIKAVEAKPCEKLINGGPGIYKVCIGSTYKYTYSEHQVFEYSPKRSEKSNYVKMNVRDNIVREYKSGSSVSPDFTFMLGNFQMVARIEKVVDGNKDTGYIILRIEQVRQF